MTLELDLNVLADSLTTMVVICHVIRQLHKPMVHVAPAVGGLLSKSQALLSLHALMLVGVSVAPKKYNFAPDITRRGATNAPIISGFLADCTV